MGGSFHFNLFTSKCKRNISDHNKDGSFENINLVVMYNVITISCNCMPSFHYKRVLLINNDRDNTSKERKGVISRVPGKSAHAQFLVCMVISDY